MRFVCILYSIRMYFICHLYVFYMPSLCILYAICMYIYTIRMYFICHPYVFYMPSACVSTFICHPYAFHMPSLSIIYAILMYYAKLPSFRRVSDYQREEGSDPINQLNSASFSFCSYYELIDCCAVSVLQMTRDLFARS